MAIAQLHEELLRAARGDRDIEFHEDAALMEWYLRRNTFHKWDSADHAQGFDAAMIPVAPRNDAALFRIDPGLSRHNRLTLP